MDQSADHSDHGENGTSASVNAAGQSLRYACVRCRSRKIKCDRQLPCGPCLLAGADCKPLEPKQRKPIAKTKSDENPQSRLRRLEDLVERLLAARDTSSSADDGLTPPTSSDTHELEEPLQSGRLVADKSGRRYITDQLWADIIDELGDDIDRLDISKPRYTPAVLGDLDHPYTGLQTGPAPNIEGLGKYPHPCHLATYWDHFVDNVDVLLKIIHKPTVQPKFLTFGLQELPPDQDALANAICFAVLTSLSEEEVVKTFAGDRTKLLHQYRRSIEKALEQARLLESPSLTAVQALVLYLHCLPSLGYTSQVWTLTGLALRIAQSLGLHRDGEKLGISPFETEQRRRLWFAICFLDNRSWQSSGTDAAILKGHGDTKLPSNIDDTDISPECDSIPVRTKVITDSTLTVIRCDIMQAGVSVGLMRDMITPRHQNYSEITPEESEKISKEIGMLHRRINTEYRQFLDLTKPAHALCDAMTSVITLKLWRVAYTSPQFYPMPETKERLFEIDVEILERAVDMWGQPWSQKWLWLLRGHIQWKSIASVALELQGRSKSPLVMRAWKALDSAIGIYLDVPFDQRTSSMFDGLLRLRARAAGQDLSPPAGQISALPTDIAPDINNDMQLDTAIVTNQPPQIDFWGNPVSRLNLPAQMLMPVTDSTSVDWQAWLQSGELIDF